MLYIHIPYCRRKCIYCDFYSGGARIADWEMITHALLNELSERMNELPPTLESLYIGGGTPSLIPPEIFESFIKGLKVMILHSGKRFDPGMEFTIEVNPEDVDMEHMKAWRTAGVNRVSVGIQTFNDNFLKSIGRTHTGAMAAEALSLLKEEFLNVSADLIFGIPVQGVEDTEADVKRLIDLQPEHVSVYSMMYEEGTALTALRDAGRLRESDEDTVSRQFKCITGLLAAAGYEHYEISNYARTGYRSQHNSGYWTGKPYLGLGPSAHSYDGNRTRRANPAYLQGYLSRFAEETLQKDVFFTEEVLTEQELLEERVMLGLRRREGLDLKKIEKEFGKDSVESIRRKARKHIDAGNLREKGSALCLSHSGIMLSDLVIVDLL